MRRIAHVDTTVNTFKKEPVMKLNPVKQPRVKGTIMDIWNSRTKKDKFEMLIEWKDGNTSIELSDVRLRVGGVITL